RFLAKHMLAGRGRRHRCLAMQVVRQSENDHVQLGHLVHLAKVREMMLDVMAFGEGLGVRFRRRRDGDYFRPWNCSERFEMNRAEKLRADQTDANRFHATAFTWLIRCCLSLQITSS